MSDSNRERMTVGRLRDILATLPQDAVVYAYEGEPLSEAALARYGMKGPCHSYLVVDMPDGTKHTIPAAE